MSLGYQKTKNSELEFQKKSSLTIGFVILSIGLLSLTNNLFVFDNKWGVFSFQSLTLTCMLIVSISLLSAKNNPHLAGLILIGVFIYAGIGASLLANVTVENANGTSSFANLIILSILPTLASLYLKPRGIFIATMIPTIVTTAIAYLFPEQDPQIIYFLEATKIVPLTPIWITVITVITSFIRLERDRRTEAIAVALQATEAARTEAERANQAKSEFLAKMAHDFRTPLNTITGNTSAVLNLIPDVPDPARSALSKVAIAGDTLTNLIDNSIDHYQIEEGRASLIIATVDTNLLIAELSTNAQVAIASRSDAIEWKLDVAEDIPNIQGDSEKLNRIFTNLIANAITHTQSGYVRFAVEVQSQDLIFTVEDTGTGIKDPVGLFTKGFSAQGSTGLGLVIAKEFTELHGGDISYDTIPGKGTTFTVRIPRHAQEKSAVL